MPEASAFGAKNDTTTAAGTTTIINNEAPPRPAPLTPPAAAPAAPRSESDNLIRNNNKNDSKPISWFGARSGYKTTFSGNISNKKNNNNGDKCDRNQNPVDNDDDDDYDEENDDDDDDDDDKERSGSLNNLNNRTTDGQTMMHILKANIGTGVLAMPLAFKNVGIWLGLFLVPVIGIICIHCMNILIRSHNSLCDRFNYESLDYDQVAALGLACGPKWARRLAKRASLIVSIFLMFTQIGFCCVYILFTVENLQVACLNLFQLDYSLITYLLVVFPVIGLTSCTSNLKHLARISTLANILQLFGLALIFFDLLQFHTYAQEQQQQEPGQEQQLVPIIRVEQGISADIGTGLPLFFATAVYAFEGIGVVLPLVKEMQQPGRISGLNGVLNTSMFMVAALYMAIGFLGYAKYGQTVAGSITLNLPESTLNELVRLAFALAIGLSYSLQFYVPWCIIWPLIDETLFYSYRPRKSRNKLSILSKLSAENQWALNEVMAEAGVEADGEEEKQKPQHQKQQQQQQSLSTSVRRRTGPGAGTDDGPLTPAAIYNDNSTASTLATSYSMSMSTNVHFQPAAAAVNQQQQQQQQLQRKFVPFTSSSSNKRREYNWLVANSATTTTPTSQYGTIGSNANYCEQQAAQARLDSSSRQQVSAVRQLVSSTEQQQLRERKQRNRLDDMRDQDSDSDNMPEVQWRPPPRSMRGKRKLVRYTIILVTVSFTCK